MVELATVARLLGGVVLLFSNGFFVTTEFALTRVRQYSEDQFQGRGLGLAWEMTERLEIYLSGCQVGITISSVGLGVVAEPALAAVIDPVLQGFGVAPANGGHTAAAVIVSLTVINLMHVIIGEQAPTYLGIERTRFVAKYGAPLLYGWTKLMWPVIKLSDWVAKAILGLFGVQIDRSWTEEELDEAPATRGDVRRQMGDALGSVDIPKERQQEVMGALDIGRIPIRDVMVPREDVLAVEVTDSVDENVDRMAGSPHVRFPLVGDSLDDYRGVVYMPPVLDALEDLRAGDTTFADLAAPPLTMDADTVVSDAIDIFQDEGQELALVTDDDAVVGLVTATDAFEQIAGDMEDPMDSAG